MRLILINQYLLCFPGDEVLKNSLLVVVNPAKYLFHFEKHNLPLFNPNMVKKRLPGGLELSKSS